MSFFILAGEEGIEPPLTVLETAALPLYYSSLLNNEHYITDSMNKASFIFTHFYSCRKASIGLNLAALLAG